MAGENFDRKPNDSAERGRWGTGRGWRGFGRWWGWRFGAGHGRDGHLNVDRFWVFF